MDKIKKLYQSIPLWLMLFIVVIIAFAAATVFTQLAENAASAKVREIQIKYLTIDGPAISGEQGVLLDKLNYHFEDYTPTDLRAYNTARFFERYSSFFLYLGCFVLAGLFFYFTKIKRPLHILENAYGSIAQNNLDFELDYDGNDEMAKLCNAFETMRSALKDNNAKMLRVVEERKEINDAYTHDLRTPVSVLKGYIEMLSKYLPSGKISNEEVVETVNTMSAQISRLEQFVDSMNTVQKLDDLTVKRESVSTSNLINSLQKSAEILCQSDNLNCVFNSSVTKETLLLDTSVVVQVYENLIGNAIRFAESALNIQCNCGDTHFEISVIDDGKGFTKTELTKAVRPYYSGEDKTELHFGLGLHICRILCEKHGGTLQLSNAPSHGAQVTATFNIKN